MAFLKRAHGHTATTRPSHRSPLTLASYSNAPPPATHKPSGTSPSSSPASEQHAPTAHKDIQTTQRYADYCPNPGGRDVVEAAFARGTNSGTNLRAPYATERN
jgi:hypothetical protein